VLVLCVEVAPLLHVQVVHVDALAELIRFYAGCALPLANLLGLVHYFGYEL
jgi:hypothetical protein